MTLFLFRLTLPTAGDALFPLAPLALCALFTRPIVLPFLLPKAAEPIDAPAAACFERSKLYENVFGGAAGVVVMLYRDDFYFL